MAIAMLVALVPVVLAVGIFVSTLRLGARPADRLVVHPYVVLSGATPAPALEPERCSERLA